MNAKHDKKRQYKKENDHSYSFGAYATIELIKSRPEMVREIYVHSNYNGSQIVFELCHTNDIPISYNDKLIERMSQKDNIYILGVFSKYTCTLSPIHPNIILINPGDSGNLGTIIRTMIGLNILDLGIITPAVDIFNPKTVRSSMGALFCIRFQQFSSFEAYISKYPGHSFFPFMTENAKLLSLENFPKTPLFSLIFGNEASGLSDVYNTIGTPIKIPQSNLTDSFNLSVAAGIGMYVFANKNELI